MRYTLPARGVNVPLGRTPWGYFIAFTSYIYIYPIYIFYATAVVVVFVGGLRRCDQQLAANFRLDDGTYANRPCSHLKNQTNLLSRLKKVNAKEAKSFMTKYESE